jgi:hypothetical protein
MTVYMCAALNECTEYVITLSTLNECSVSLVGCISTTVYMCAALNECTEYVITLSTLNECSVMPSWLHFNDSRAADGGQPALFRLRK